MGRHFGDSDVTFRCAGFVFLGERGTFDDAEGYEDYRRTQWTVAGITRDLDAGNLPPGMMVQAERQGKTGQVGVVMGDWGRAQWIALLVEVMGLEMNSPTLAARRAGNGLPPGVRRQ